MTKDKYIVNFVGFNKTMTDLNSKDLDFLETVLDNLKIPYEVAVVTKTKKITAKGDLKTIYK